MADSGNGELLALLAEMKKSVEAAQEEMKKRQDEMKQGQERMEQEMRSGQERMEEMKAGLEKEMRSGQERMEQMTAGLEKKLKSGQEEMKKEIREHVEVQVEGMKEHVNECTGKTEGESPKCEKGNRRYKRQKLGESLQVLAADVERLMSLAYAECPLDIRESLAAQYFFDAIVDEDTQHSTRLMDAKDLKSALAYSMKYEAARIVSKTSKHVRSIEVEEDSEKKEDTFESLFNRYVVTNSPNQISEKAALVAATLVDLKKVTIPVRVLNVDNKPKTMDKGAVIASYEPVVDIVTRPQEFSGKQPIQSILENIEGLNEDQRIPLQKLLQEFQHLFSTCDADVGRCSVTQHKIYTGDHPPIKQYPRRLHLARKEEAERLIKEMVDSGIIEESSGTWASPIVLVKNKDGSTREHEGQVARWIQRLPEYDFEIQHRKGTSHGNADALSRRPCKDGVLYRKWDSDDGSSWRWQLILPKSLIPEVLCEIHNSASGGRFGVMKTLSKTRERFYWDRLRANVEKWCRECHACGARKGPKTRTKGHLQRYNVGAPFERMALDILGPFPVTANDNLYVLVLMDYFMKWPVAIPIPDQGASTVAEELVSH
ncbi:Gypsy retrotransposon integrase-like protein 1 [Argiope bruennichi]|uniref:RNA-directed DNA polymerase n=1 Tax=Argiope bruennichi TaxID=94029 RepID=A0A8T0EKV4_ARGBR|nr:Gypsy retrotransposon integrase-like protein 1 [Argiope bruennichi]